MAETFKIDKIENLTQKELRQLLETILGKTGLQIDDRQDTYIIASQNSTFSTIKLLFVFFNKKLSSLTSDEVDIIANDVHNIYSQSSIGNIHIISNHTISNGFKNKFGKKYDSILPTYVDRNLIIKLVNDNFPDYWRHNDLALLHYEDEFKQFVEEDSNLRRISLSTDKYKKKLNFFIEPQLTHSYEDKKTKTLVRKRYSVEGIMQQPESLIIDGMNGAGKTVILKRIGLKLINSNATQEEKKSVPLFITAQEILKSNIDISELILSKLHSLNGEAGMYELTNKYNIHLLVDSIDELEEQQEKILNSLSELEKKYHLKYYIATRNYEALPQIPESSLSVFRVAKFNYEQIKQFLMAFFPENNNKTNLLLEALRENKIIERLPITPLTLSLISILYEEKDLEIPATISDVYDNFNALIVGQAIVSSKIELIDANFRERILSVYALNLMETPNADPLSEGEFINFFVDFFADKSYTIKGGSIEEALHYIIHNTGILFLKDNTFVQFCHNSYMEYYAAREIFNHTRSKEKLLVDNFYDTSWQNTAIFYAGMSKDMPDFLSAILNKIRGADSFSQYFSAILGCGYLIQALYTTDNKIRKDIILESLRISLDALHLTKKSISDYPTMYGNITLPTITIINFIYFYESFNSITLIEPLKMAFNEIYLKLNERLPSLPLSRDECVGLGYNLLEVAFTLDSKRLKDTECLEKLLDNSFILNDPSLVILADVSIDYLNKTNYQVFKNKLRKEVSSFSSIEKKLINTPLHKLRFTPLDTINPYKEVKIIVEGTTDARILEHAFYVLTGGHMPYWTIKPGGPAEGKSCAEGVRKALENGFSLVSNNDIIIGVVDHDAAGLKEYRYLVNDFEELSVDRVKKHKDSNIYIVTLPVPGEMDFYLKEEQEYNLFSIEHYFGHEYLETHNMLKKSEIPDIMKINDGAKTSFASAICNEINPEIFKYFLELFHQIDKLANENIDYLL